MSLKESLRRRQINNFGYTMASITEGDAFRAKLREERKQNKESFETMQNNTRRKPLQVLDKSSKQKEDYETFYNSIKINFTEEYNTLQTKNTKSLKQLLYVYKIHITKLQECDKHFSTKYANKFMQHIFTTDSEFLNILLPKTKEPTI